ncbi:MAG: hypothetical protein JST12_17805 [Armatimonadetes bacterium]|nr:hypothetical protein [Armatimonadota bacterium]MBS1703524.1 hypothetical protein [Armatimonadota bacterium]
MSASPFTNEEIARLRDSFLVLIPVTDELAGTFYNHFFAEHPEVRVQFKPDIQSQQDKLVETFAALLDVLHRPDMAEPVLMSLGKQHVHYGATNELYDWVAKKIPNLIADELTPGPEADQLVELWSRLMLFVVETMMKGAAEKS